MKAKKYLTRGFWLFTLLRFCSCSVRGEQIRAGVWVMTLIGISILVTALMIYAGRDRV